MSPSAHPVILIAAHTRGLAPNLAATLTTAGHHTRTLEAASAIELSGQIPARISADQPSLLILELKQSADALAALRAMHPALPVVVLLSAARPEVAFAAARLGAAQMLLLSQSDEEISAAISQALNHPNSAPIALPTASSTVSSAPNMTNPVKKPSVRRQNAAASPLNKPSISAVKKTATEGIFTISKRASLEAEAVEIRRALVENRWNRKRAAAHLQMSYKSLLNRLKVLETRGLLG